jgi:hypothetical protein
VSKKKLEVFVKNRVSEIKDKGVDIDFKYVNTKENPADLGTRGLSYEELQNSCWFHGPKWLLDNPQKWPTWSDESKPSLETPMMIEAEVIVRHPPYSIDITGYSKWDRLLRVTSYCRRFIDNLKTKKRPDRAEISPKEMRDSRYSWIKHIQETEYTEVLTLLRHDKMNPLIRQLNLHLDQDGLIRCGGRIAYAEIAEDSKFPILLPTRHHFTKLVIEFEHEKVLHFGAKSTLTEVRRTFWIPHGMAAVRKAIKGCVRCRRLEGGPFKPPRLASLPKERLTKAPAFKYTGLDYLGPLYIKEPGKGNLYVKRWIALFTCFTTRAIHLEIVPDCTTLAALNAVRRFMSRRGVPHTILSDNAMQFKKSASIMREIWGKKAGEELLEGLVKFFARKGIEWKNIPERSPWAGGFYERLVGLVKRAIKKVLWKSTMTQDQLNTLVHEVEGVINSRPLLSVTGDNPEDCKVLTPAHFLAPGTQLSLPPQDKGLEEDPDYLPNPRAGDDFKSLYTKNMRKLDSLWKVWNTSYLQELRALQNSYHKVKKGEVPREPELGEVVLIKEATPRSTWKMGKVVKKYKGDDDQVRFIKLKTSGNKEFKRGVKEVVPLELDIERGSVGSLETQTHLLSGLPTNPFM